MVRPAKTKVYQQKKNGALAILIPKSIQESMGVTKGQRFVVYDDHGRIVFERWENFAGDRVAAAITGADADAE